MIDRKAWRDRLRALGEDPSREGLERTVQRFEEAMDEMMGGYRQDPAAILQAGLFHVANASRVPVTIRGIEFWSLCEHHLMPFFGTATITYTPAGSRVIGLSRLPRVVYALSRRLQTQEGLTNDIACAIDRSGASSQVQVRIEARHTCMEARGVRAAHAETITEMTIGGNQASFT